MTLYQKDTWIWRAEYGHVILIERKIETFLTNRLQFIYHSSNAMYV